VLCHRFENWGSKWPPKDWVGTLKKKIIADPELPKSKDHIV